MRPVAVSSAGTLAFRRGTPYTSMTNTMAATSRPGRYWAHHAAGGAALDLLLADEFHVFEDAAAAELDDLGVP